MAGIIYNDNVSFMNVGVTYQMVLEVRYDSVTGGRLVDEKRYM
jgi:hypothetical protein